MNRTSQLFCIHATAVFIALVGGAFVVAGWVPPFSPDQSASAIADQFRDETNVRIAAAMFFFGACVFVVPAAAITAQMRRIEGRNHVFAHLQLASAAVGVIAIQIPAALWLAITYRDGVPDEVIVTLNDVSWFFLLGAVGSAVVQNLSIALCVFSGDGSVYPRWMGYATLWFTFGLLPGIFIPFVKTGPLAWDGILGFWVVATAFFAWLIMVWVMTAKAIRSETEGVPA